MKNVIAKVHPKIWLNSTNSLVLSGVCLGDLLDHEHPGVAVVLDLVPAAVLDGFPVEGPRDVRLRVAPHVAHEAHVAVQDLETDGQTFIMACKESTFGPAGFSLEIKPL